MEKINELESIRKEFLAKLKEKMNSKIDDLDSYKEECQDLDKKITKAGKKKEELEKSYEDTDDIEKKLGKLATKYKETLSEMKES